jgi:hypothetical protein
LRDAAAVPYPQEPAAINRHRNPVRITCSATRAHEYVQTRNRAGRRTDARARTGEGERGGVVGGLGVAHAAVAGGGEREEEEQEREQENG